MSENLIEGLTLLAMGMGFVLTFLCVMIFSMRVMSFIVGYLNKIFPVAVEGNDKKLSGKQTDDAALALALAAAILNKREGI